MFATFKYTLSDNTPFSSIRVITWNVTNAINSASVYSKVTRSPVHIGELKMMCLLQSVPTPTSHITISPSFRSVLSTILVKKCEETEPGGQGEGQLQDSRPNRTYSRRPRCVAFGICIWLSSLIKARVMESLASSCWYRRRSEPWFFDKTWAPITRRVLRLRDRLLYYN